MEFLGLKLQEDKESRKGAIIVKKCFTEDPAIQGNIFPVNEIEEKQNAVIRCYCENFY